MTTKCSLKRMDTANQCCVKVEVSFPSKRFAEIAYDVLRIDAEPKRSLIAKNLSFQENILEIILCGELRKNVRVGLTSFFDSLILCSETLDQFGPESDKYDY